MTQMIVVDILFKFKDYWMNPQARHVMKNKKLKAFDTIHTYRMY